MASSDIASDEKQSPTWQGWAVTAMIVCLAISILSAAEALIPGWSGKREVLMGIVIAAIEAMYSCRVLRLPRSRGISMLRYRLAEACLLGILLKLLSYVGHSWSRSWTDVGSEIMAMLWQPSTFFSGNYLILLAAAWITWIIVNRVLADFEALQDPHLSHGEPYAPRETLMSRFYCGGGLLVLFIGIPHVVAIPSLADRPSLPYTGGYHVHALLYFLLGTLMLSQVRFTSLMTGWRLQDIAVADGVGKAWTRYGLVFLVLMVMIVAVLPTHYSMGLLDTALLGLKVLVDLVRRLMELLILAVTLPLSWLLRLIGQGEGGELRPPPIARILAPELEQRGGSSFPWEVIRALLFWLTFVAVVLYLIRSYLEDQPELVKAFKTLLIARRMVDGLAALMALLAAWSRKGLHWRPRFVSDCTTRYRRSRVISGRLRSCLSTSVMVRGRLTPSRLQRPSPTVSAWHVPCVSYSMGTAPAICRCLFMGTRRIQQHSASSSKPSGPSIGEHHDASEPATLQYDLHGILARLERKGVGESRKGYSSVDFAMRLALLPQCFHSSYSGQDDV